MSGDQGGLFRRLDDLQASLSRTRGVVRDLIGAGLADDFGVEVQGDHLVCVGDAGGWAARSITVFQILDEGAIEVSFWDFDDPCRIVRRKRIDDPDDFLAIVPEIKAFLEGSGP